MLVITLLFPYPKTASGSEVVTLPNIFAEPEPKKIEIEVVDSEYIKEQKNIVVPPLLKKIRYCESKDNYKAQNSRSTASGAYQFLKGTWGNYMGYAEAKLAPNWVQDKKAVEVFQKQGTRPWLASRSCWDTNYAPRANLTVNFKVLYKDLRYGDRSCVRFAKAQTGITRSIGNGGRSGIQGKVPKVGSIGVERYRVHAVVVTAVNGNMVTFKEAAFVNYFITQRTLPVSHFLGFIYS